MKKCYYSFMSAVAVMLLTLTGCMDNLQPEQSPIQDNTYVISVKLTKNLSTKGLNLSDDGKSIISTWNADDKVYVSNYTKQQDLTGYLQPVTAGGATTILQGTVTGVIEKTDKLMLALNPDSYDLQDGTLEYIDQHCESASVITSIQDIDASNNITIQSTSLAKKQAIVRFTLKDGDATLNASELVLIHKVKYWYDDPDTLTLRIPPTTYTINGDGVVFVSLPGDFWSEKPISLTATVNGLVYTFEKDDVGFSGGTYRHITVGMTRNDNAIPLTFEAKDANSSITFTAGNGISFDEHVEYRTELSGVMSEWAKYISGTQIVLPSVGDKVMFKGDLPSYGTASSGSKFAIGNNKNSYVYGNVMSLLSKTDFDEANTLSEPYTFRSLFSGCGYLNRHPSKELLLPATTLTEGCYNNMFTSCQRLTVAPTLPATTLAAGCYTAMFSNCDALSTAPVLPAMEMKRECYKSMFSDCDALTSMPNLPATTVAEQCYYNMFYDCDNLTTLCNSLPAATAVDSCYYSMFESCSALQTVPSGFLPATSAAVRSYAYMFWKCNKLASAPEISASTLGNNCCFWMFKGCTQLAAAPTIKASELAAYCCRSMFEGCTNLTTLPSSLPAMTLKDDCYYEMFKGCTKLETIPSAFLPATTLGSSCYYGMFCGCEKLTTLPTSLPAPELRYYCYYEMFKDCSSLETVPSNFLPALTLAEYCYSKMFNGCTKLTSAPALPAILNNKKCSSCYSNMFNGCTSLQTAPTLSSTTLAESCYSNMFKGCTNLTSAPVLAAETLQAQCYFGMFDGCTNLTTAPNLPATTLSSSCYKYMFRGCTDLQTAPVIDATLLANNCCESMFEGCTSLTASPVLKAPLLVERCYINMFKSCSNLASVTCLATNITAELCTAAWLHLTKTSGDRYFTTPAGTNWSTDSASGIPTGWTRVNYVAN